jgi:hypothetical protein
VEIKKNTVSELGNAPAEKAQQMLRNKEPAKMELLFRNVHALVKHQK